MSAAFFGKLITLNKKIQRLKGKFILCGINSTIFETFEITKLDLFFKIYKTEEAALQAF